MTNKQYYEQMSALNKELCWQLRFAGDESRAFSAAQKHQAAERKLEEMTEAEKNQPVSVQMQYAVERTRNYVQDLILQSGGESDCKTLDVMAHPNDCPYLYKKATTRPALSCRGDN